MKQFVKFQNVWWEYDQSTSPMFATIYSNSSKKLTNVNISGLEKSYAESFFHLDWTNTAIFSQHYKTGWLSPDGKFFGCDFHFHDDQAFLVHKQNEDDLEKQGWIKISYDPVKNGVDSDKLEAFFDSDDEMVYPTNKQLSYISSHYTGRDKECMITKLFHIRAIKTQLIREDWGIER
ncbi:MAG: hypothetical protein IJA69_00380 [Clostridia bacterium]|nr:hypothetical protein [Clostridia bacterium]